LNDKIAPPDTGRQPVELRSRRATDGDVAPVQTPTAIAGFVASGAIEAARVGQEAAVRDLIRGMLPGKIHELADALRAVMEGASPDDARALRKALLTRSPPADGASSPDDELADGWREGVYPYRNLMQRKTYEHQKYSLQVELLKLQAWVKDAEQKVVILFEGRDAAGKGAPSNALWNISTRAVRVSLRWKSPV
jgi:hypothetical protein